MSKYAARIEEIGSIPNTSYEYYPETLTSEEDSDNKIGIKQDSIEFEMLFKGTENEDEQYFLASRSCKATDKGTDYCIKMIANESVKEYEMLDSTGKESMCSAGIRPVIILNSDAVLTKTNDGWNLI